MYGYSYSGFNSIQIAMERPPALKAIIPVYATDDRFGDDVHYQGGVVKQLDQIDYPSYMVASNALPPAPPIYGEGWREEWTRRLERAEPWVLTWLEHQRLDDYWKQGSLCVDYEAIECPTMIVAGWADGYRNNSFRTFERLTCPKRLVFGPWAHAGTDTSLPGPNHDLMPEHIRWWDRWLKGVDNGIDREPPIVLYAQRSTLPAPDRAVVNGEWRYEPTWPPERLRPETWSLGDAMANRPGDGPDELDVRGDVGTDRVDLVRRRAAVGPARRPAPRRAPLPHVHVGTVRAGLRDPRTRAGACAHRLERAGRLPVGEALRRLPRRHLVARRAQRVEPHAPRFAGAAVADAGR